MLKTAFCSLALAVLLAGLSMTPVDAKAKKRVAAAAGCTASALMRDESRFWACQAKKTAEVKPKKKSPRRPAARRRRLCATRAASGLANPRSDSTRRKALSWEGSGQFGRAFLRHDARHFTQSHGFQVSDERFAFLVVAGGT